MAKGKPKAGQKARGRWATVEGRLLSIGTQLERAMKEFGLVVPKDPNMALKEGLVYGSMRVAVEVLHKAAPLVEAQRAIEDAERAGKGIRMVNDAVIRAFGGRP